MPLIVPYMESIQYDGTNSAYICGTWADVKNLGETETELHISGEGGDAVRVTPGTWLLKHRDFPTWLTACPNDEYLEQYRELT